MSNYKFQCPAEPLEEDNGFPEDEVDYYIKISNEANRIGRAMVSSKDPEEARVLNEKYVRLQNWLTEISFNNIWND